MHKSYVFHVSRLWPRPDALWDPIAFRETAPNFSTCHVPFLPRRKRGVFFFRNFSPPGSLKGHFSPPSEGAQEGWAGATMGRKIGPNSSPPPLSPRPHRVFFLPSALSWLGAGEERGRKSPPSLTFFPPFSSFLFPTPGGSACTCGALLS